MSQSYLESIILIERLHRLFLDVVKIELEGQGISDINNVQALILYNIGDGELTVGELTSRGYYLGSNVSYNVKKMVENGYLSQERSAHDRRSIKVKLSSKGLKLRDKISAMYQRHIKALENISLDELSASNATLRKLERFWGNVIDYTARGPELRISAA